MLGESGYGALNVDAVAERAGVAKTTVYRRWPSKGALLAALIPSPGEYSATEAVLRDVQTLLAPLADAGDDSEILGVIRAILRSRRPALIALAGEERADELLGALWMRLFVST